MLTDLDPASRPPATSPELLLAAVAALGRPHRATERDLVEALSLPLDDSRGTPAGISDAYAWRPRAAAHRAAG